MSNEDIVTQIAASIRGVRRDDSLVIDRNTDIVELGIDSLDFVELLFDLEEKFNVDIPFNANDDGSFPFSTVGSAAEAIEQLLAQGAKAA
ncbi:MAG: acyl carrier protein [Allosphingosinicella sp.]